MHTQLPSLFDNVLSPAKNPLVIKCFHIFQASGPGLLSIGHFFSDFDGLIEL
jgi:hypothetical protein